MTGQAIESLRAEKRSLSFSPTISDTLQALALSPEQGFILSRVDGTSTPREILSLSPLGEEETARALIDLLECGLVKLNDEAPTEPAEAPAEAPTPDSASAPESALAPDPAIAKKRNELEELVDACSKQTPTELLGVSDQASTDEIKEAFRKKVLCFHPDRYPGITDEAFLKKLGVPGLLAERLFALGLDIDHVFVLQNTVTVRRPGGWDEDMAGSVSEVARSFLRFYDEEEWGSGIRHHRCHG